MIEISCSNCHCRIDGTPVTAPFYDLALRFCTKLCEANFFYDRGIAQNAYANCKNCDKLKLKLDMFRNGDNLRFCDDDCYNVFIKKNLNFERKTQEYNRFIGDDTSWTACATCDTIIKTATCYDHGGMGYCDENCYQKRGQDKPKPDSVNHPAHYTSHPSGVECIQITEHMSFTLGNAIKYIWRADLKNGTEDIKKAIWYLNRELLKRKDSNETAD